MIGDGGDSHGASAVFGTGSTVHPALGFGHDKPFPGYLEDAGGHWGAKMPTSETMCAMCGLQVSRPHAGNEKLLL